MRGMLTIHQRAVLVGFVLIGCALSVQAQSGRRSASKPTTTTPSVDGPKKVEAKSQKPPRVQFLLIVEDPNPFNQTPYYLSDTVVNECARRLEEAAHVLAKPEWHAGTDGGQGEASITPLPVSRRPVG